MSWSTETDADVILSRPPFRQKTIGVEIDQKRAYVEANQMHNGMWEVEARIHADKRPVWADRVLGTAEMIRAVQEAIGLLVGNMLLTGDWRGR